MAAPQREIALRLPARLVRQLEAVARRDKTNLSALVVEAVRRDLAGSRQERRRSRGPHGKRSGRR